jgi:hypothetical protein
MLHHCAPHLHHMNIVCDKGLWEFHSAWEGPFTFVVYPFTFVRFVKWFRMKDMSLVCDVSVCICTRNLIFWFSRYFSVRVSSENQQKWKNNNLKIHKRKWLPLWGPLDDPVASIHATTTWHGKSNNNENDEDGIVEPLMKFPLRIRSRKPIYPCSS